MIKGLNYSGLELRPHCGRNWERGVNTIANTLYSQLERFLIIPNSVYLTLSNSIGLDLKWSNSTILEKEGGKK
jgi:hypothetical protein